MAVVERESEILIGYDEIAATFDDRAGWKEHVAGLGGISDFPSGNIERSIAGMIELNVFAGVLRSIRIRKYLIDSYERWQNRRGARIRIRRGSFFGTGIGYSDQIKERGLRT